MNAKQPRQYLAIDLKSFYASVECVERGLDPLDACLVVADPTRTEKTICLAVSPALKACGISGRARLFEVVQRVREVNRSRGWRAASTSAAELKAHPEYALDYIVAPPRMALYMDYSTRIYQIYIRFISSDDILVYSIDEVIMDVTDYLGTYGMTAHQLAIRMIREVLAETGITATAGIGTNMYLCKIAMDIVAKKMPPDADGVRIAELNEMSYRQQLWDHTPITDFWRVGRGIAGRLAQYGLKTMGDVARCSIDHEGLLYQLLGVNAELLIDHAWGREPVTIAQAKAYRPESQSMSSGQVLQCAYTVEKARVVTEEMADAVSLELIDKRMLTDQIVLEVGYDVDSLKDTEISNGYDGAITTDRYGRRVPAHAHGTTNFDAPTSSSHTLTEAILALFDRIVNPILLVRRITISANRLISEAEYAERKIEEVRQLDLFTDYGEQQLQEERRRKAIAKERRGQEAVLRIKKTFGKNAILKGINYRDGATQRDRNSQIGGHKA